MVQHLRDGGHQLFGQRCVEVPAGVLEGPLIVEDHPLGADKPQPNDIVYSVLAGLSFYGSGSSLNS